MKLKLDEVEAGDRLRDRVPVLQPRVDPYERKGLGRRLVEELDRAGAAVAGAQRQTPRRVQDLALLLGHQHRARRLLDDLLVAALARAIARADRPRAAAAVGDDLHLDVARRRHELLEQHGAVAEGLLGLGLRAGERGRKRFGLVDAADAAPAAPSRRLDHDREADARGVPERLVDGLDGTAAPRRHRHAGCFGEPLGRDPVASQTHDRCVGPDEDDAEPLAQFGELGLRCDEAPPDPDRIGARLAQGALQRLVVEVAAVERDCLVGVADEHRVALGLRVERDDAYRLGAVDVELAHGVDDPHGGLPAVDDRKPGERALHRSAAHRRADRRERVGADAPGRLDRPVALQAAAHLAEQLLGSRQPERRAGDDNRFGARRQAALAAAHEVTAALEELDEAVGRPQPAQCAAERLDVTGLRVVRGEAKHGVVAEHVGGLDVEPRRDGRAHGP